MSHIDIAITEGPVETVPLNWPGPCGAESVFLGRTREETHDTFGALEYLEYEVFEPMALKVLQEMCDEAASRFGCHAIRLAHSKGRVDPGQASVVIQVATPHRSESFDACRYLIDRLKHDLPVWKVEQWRDGRTRVEGCCAPGAVRRESG